MTLTEFSTAAGLIGLIASVMLLAWQTRAVAQQTKISNAIAGASILEATTSQLREVFLVFVERPGLRAYFYESKRVPSGSQRRSRVIATAEILGDALEAGLVMKRLVPTTESLEDWAEYARQMLTTSPILHKLSRQHPEWWPELARLQPHPPNQVAAT